MGGGSTDPQCSHVPYTGLLAGSTPHPRKNLGPSSCLHDDENDNPQEPLLFRSNRSPREGGKRRPCAVLRGQEYLYSSEHWPRTR